MMVVQELEPNIKNTLHVFRKNVHMSAEISRVRMTVPLVTKITKSDNKMNSISEINFTEQDYMQMQMAQSMQGE